MSGSDSNLAVEVRPISAEQARLLRQSILRPGQPAQSCVYPGDDDEGTGHFGAFMGDVLIGISSVFREDQPDRKPALTPGWRIRGMATEEHVRGKGYGAALLSASVEHARERGAAQVWCNGRTSVAGFYQGQGFAAVGEVFDLPGIGPHLVFELDCGALR